MVSEQTFTGMAAMQNTFDEEGATRQVFFPTTQPKLAKFETKTSLETTTFAAAGAE